MFVELKKIYLFFREAQIAWFKFLKSVGKDIEAAAFQELIISEGMNYISSKSNSFLLVHSFVIHIHLYINLACLFVCLFVCIQ